MVDDWAGFRQLVEKVGFRVLVACAGEDHYPNISKRKVEVLPEEHALFFVEDKTSRTVHLLKTSPRVIVLAYDWERGYGIKGKGEMTFYPEGPWCAKAREQFAQEGKAVELAEGAIVRLKALFPF